jgi:hypothetical protein
MSKVKVRVTARVDGGERGDDCATCEIGRDHHRSARDAIRKRTADQERRQEADRL